VISPVPTTLVAAPQIVIFPPPYGVGLFHVSATLTSGGNPLGGEPISFSVGKTTLCSASTARNGTASCKLRAKAEIAVLLGNSYTATFAGDTTHLGSTATTPAILLGTVPHICLMRRPRWPGPRSRAPGEHSYTNTQPAHPKCNESKHARMD
jgi:hypothetical protein